MSKSLYEKYSALGTAREREASCYKLSNAQLASLKTYSDALVAQSTEKLRQHQLAARQWRHEVAARPLYVEEAQRRGVDPMYLVEQLLGPADASRAPGLATIAAIDPDENPTVVEFRKKLRGG